MLLSNQLDSLYGGVNQQSAENRLPTQVEEMINAYPTLDSGLRKRNPNTKLSLTSTLTYSDDMWTYAYDRGTIGTNEEKYIVNIVSGSMEIINILTGKVYKDGEGIDFTNKDYLISTDAKSFAATTIKDFTFITNKSTLPQATLDTSDTAYKKIGYVWINSANPSYPYTYTVTINNGSSHTVTASAETSVAVATSLASSLNAISGITATSVGSVVRLISTTDITLISSGDSYGDQASFAWSYEVESLLNLPKTLGFTDGVVKITGTNGNLFSTYWLKYTGTKWEEVNKPDYDVSVDETTMPHVLIRNADDTFTFKPYDGWASPSSGDEDSNPLPSFLNGDATIRDIFFFKNRLGLITERTVILSEVGEYGNFFRTTTAALLDSDYIDATVDTTEVISLNYATYIEDSVMLFSDKAQFKLEGGRVLSPKDVQISQTSAYEIDINVRPLFMNDKIFFCARRGSYTAVMEYVVNQNSGNTSEAIDISAHVQTYIPTGITSLSGSSINNMLFLTSSEKKDTIFVYKYYESGGDKVQSAWFKWTYNGDIYFANSLGRNLNIALSRKTSDVIADWVLSTSYWDDNSYWLTSSLWYDNEDSIGKINTFETSPVFPQAYTDTFLDPSGDDGISTPIPTYVSLGEWIPNKDIRGHIQFKTIKISSEEDSVFNLRVSDINRDTHRDIDSKYTVKRSPMIYGNANNIRIAITNSETTGFRINTVSYEGSLNKRDYRR